MIIPRMRYLTIRTKFTYYLEVGLHTFILFFLGYLFQYVWPSGLALFVLLTMVIYGAWYFVHMNRNIYARIDTASKTLEFGNVFFYQETSLANVKYSGRAGLTRQLHKIKIGDRTYIINSMGKDVKFLFTES